MKKENETRNNESALVGVEARCFERGVTNKQTSHHLLLVTPDETSG